MYPDTFDLYRPDDVGAVLDLLEEYADEETELIAGGHSLLPTMKSGLASPDVLIDIGDVDALQGIEEREETLVIGAMTTYATLAVSDVLWEAAPELAEASAAIGDRQVRNMGTLGGNIAHADPAADLPGAIIAANATMVIEGRDGVRRVNADDFFLGMFETDVASDELITSVEVPKATDSVGAYVKRPSPSSGYAIVGVAARLECDGDTIVNASVGANGIVDHGVRLVPVERSLEDESLVDDVIEEAAGRATENLDQSTMMADSQASAQFRADLVAVYTERVLRSVAERHQS